MLLMIPVYAIHHDPDFYTDPECFIPERFETKDRDPNLFMPFGKKTKHGKDNFKNSYSS